MNINFRFVLENPDIVKDKSVLDVGSGCGATSIAAIMKKAKYAVANDIDEGKSVSNTTLNKNHYREINIGFKSKS